ncbi:hypothetical protein [Bradyrhizobium sp. ORS 86]|uniref:hypothetical protein n=1 Tax=Bradyrhizobium sp. ORS 86 TaxID=1685970 RepID=UPI00389017BF
MCDTSLLVLKNLGGPIFVGKWNRALTRDFQCWTKCNSEDCAIDDRRACGKPEFNGAKRGLWLNSAPTRMSFSSVCHGRFLQTL